MMIQKQQILLSVLIKTEPNNTESTGCKKDEDCKDNALKYCNADIQTCVGIIFVIINLKFNIHIY